MRIVDLTGQTQQDEAEHRQSLAWIDSTDDPVIALGRLYPAGFHVPVHSHAKAQLWCARKGVVLVSTSGGRWMLPPGHGLLIPAGLEHATDMISEVDMHSVYMDARTTRADQPRVLQITPLAASLAEELVTADEPAMSARRKRLIMELLLDEIGQLVERPLGLPFPVNQKLARLCRQFLRSPDARVGIDDWATSLGMSRRSFTRLFRAETGVSFVTWRQQASIFASLPRLADGDPVTNVALDAGYENIAAFTTMFRRMLGHSPSTYLKSRAH